MRRVIRLGDLTTHGGRVVQASDRYTMDDIPVARMGDHCTCPIPGHAGCVIVEGDPNWTIDGKPVALEGHLTSCGAALISTFGRLERHPDSDARADASNANAAKCGTSPDSSMAGEVPCYDEQVQLKAQRIAGVPYYISTSTGRVFSGRTDEDGILPRVMTQLEEEYTLLVGDEALAKISEGNP